MSLNPPTKTYARTGKVNATPMARGAYNELRGWAMPEGENPNDPGYLTEDAEHMVTNVRGFTGHITWVPAPVFEACHKPACEGLSFGAAIEALKAGKTVTRTGWNGKGMFLFLLQGSNALAKVHGLGFGEYPGEPTFRDAIFMRTADNQLVPWTVAQSDALAEDWVVLDWRAA